MSTRTGTGRELGTAVHKAVSGLADKAHLSVSHVIAPCWLTRQSERYAELAARSLPLMCFILWLLYGRQVSLILEILDFIVHIYSFCMLFSLFYLFNCITGWFSVLSISNQTHSPMLHKTFRKFCLSVNKNKSILFVDISLGF